jgi:hypothetical protein
MCGISDRTMRVAMNSDTLILLGTLVLTMLAMIFVGALALAVLWIWINQLQKNYGRITVRLVVCDISAKAGGLAMAGLMVFALYPSYEWLTTGSTPFSFMNWSFNLCVAYFAWAKGVDWRGVGSTDHM